MATQYLRIKETTLGRNQNSELGGGKEENNGRGHSLTLTTPFYPTVLDPLEDKMDFLAQNSIASQQQHEGTSFSILHNRP